MNYFGQWTFNRNLKDVIAVTKSSCKEVRPQEDDGLDETLDTEAQKPRY
jgi:hypothetical protein